MIQKVDGAELRRLLLSAAAAIEIGKEKLNELNVFPVPDGDTGTNMSMTINAAAAELRKLEEPTVEKASATAASAMLRGARGNSGVILSLLMRGISRKLKGAECCDGVLWAKALQEGVDAAYKAVMKPAEGTILTVIDEAAEFFFGIIQKSPIDAVAVGQLYTLIGMLLPLMSCQQDDNQTELIEKVKALIAEDHKFTVAELSKKCAVSQSALYSAFKKHSDKSIQELKKEVSMEAAKDLLLSTDEPIEEISQRLGFSSGTYFRKCFNDFYGISPRAMRAKFKI